MAGRRRHLPRAVLGAVVVVACGVAFALVSTSRGEVTEVLAVTSAVPAGHVLQASDLRRVRVSADPEAGLIPASATDTVVGRTAAVPLAAGGLLTRSLVGAVAYPQPGQAVVGLAVKAGQFPPGLAPGARVAVMVAPNSTAAGAPPGGPAAAPRVAVGVVLAVDPAADHSSQAVVTVQMTQADGQGVAVPAAAGQVSVVQLAPQGGGGR